VPAYYAVHMYELPLTISVAPKYYHVGTDLIPMDIIQILSSCSSNQPFRMSHTQTPKIPLLPTACPCP